MVDSRWESEYRARTIRETPYLRGEPADVQLLMYEATHRTNDGQTLRALLSQMNPDTRTKEGHTALWLSCIGGGAAVPFLIPALEQHYANDPKRLLAALEATPRAKKSNHPHPDRENYQRDFTQDCYMHYLVIEAKERVKVKLCDPEMFFEVLDHLHRGSYQISRYVQFLQDYMNNGVSANSNGPKGVSLLWHMADCKDGAIASQCGRIVLTKLLEEFPPSRKPKELLAALTDINRTGDGKLPAERFAERRITGLSQEIERAIAEAKQALINLPAMPTTTTIPASQSTPGASKTGTAAKSTKPSQPARPLVSFTRSGISYDKLMRVQGGETVLEQLAERDELGKVFTPEIWKGRKDEMLMVWHEVPARHQHQVDIDNLAILIGGSRADKAKVPAQPREPGF